MATNIFAQLGFSFNKSSVTNVVQATTTIKDSIINLGPIFNDFQKKIDAASDVTKWVGFGTAFSGFFSGIKSSVASVVGDVKKLYDFVDGYARKGDKIAKTSRLVGLSVKDYQALSSAAMDSGMSIADMDSALKKFNVNLAKARGGDKTMLGNFSKALFGKNNAAKQLDGLKTNRDVIIALASSYSKLQTSEQKALVSSELFGKSGLQMSEILSQGGESLEKFLNAYDKGFSEEGASNAEAFTHEFQKMHEEFEQIKMSVAMDLFPVFKDLFSTISDALHGGGSEELKKQFSSLGKTVGKFVVDLMPRIPKILDSIVEILDVITPQGALIALSIVKIVPMLTTIFGFAKAIGVVLSGSVLAIVGGILILFVEIASIVKQFYDNWDMWCSFVNNELTDAVNDFFAGIWNGIKRAGSFLYELFIDPFVKFFSVLPAIASQAWDGFKSGIAQIGSFIYDTFFGAISSAINGAKGLLKSLPLVGGLFDDGDPNGGSTSPAAPSQIASAVQQSYSVTTNRFAVDFNNVPRGTNITPPPQGDFDWSRSYTLAGAV